MIPTEPHGRVHRVLEPVRTQLVERIKDLVRKLSPNGHFPGPNPCSIERADLTTLNPRDYKICEKTDGTRMMLAFLTHDGLRLALLVGRAWDVYIATAGAIPTAWFQGTAFDGELLDDVWLGFDAMYVCGIPVFAEPLPQRLAAAAEAMTAYSRTSGDSFEIRFKAYYDTFDDYAAVGKIDGIILTPIRQPVVVGRHRALYKLKDAGKHTVDFEHVQKRLKVYDPAQKKAVVVGKLIDAPPKLPRCIVEAAWVQGDTWKFVGVREDKTTCNDLLTFEKTKLNVQENLTIDDLKRVWTVEINSEAPGK